MTIRACKTEPNQSTNLSMKLFKHLILLTFLISPQLQAAPADGKKVSAKLISEVSHIEPGSTFWVGVSYSLAPHWHLYWKNPGDSGLPPDITWDLPSGLSTGDIVWPYPLYIEMGGLASFGYETSLLLMVPIQASEDVKNLTDITLKATTRWLVCETVCLPGDQDVSLTLPVASGPADLSTDATEFSKTRKQLPLDLPSSGITASLTADSVVLSIPASALNTDTPSLRFFPGDETTYQNTAKQTLDTSEKGLTLTLLLNTHQEAPPARLSGTLVADSDYWAGQDGRRALNLDLAFGAKIASATLPTDDEKNFGVILFWAFIGGFILNLMPCVFPVLGLKIMGFVEQAGASRARVTGHGIWFTIGVLVSFWILAGILIAIRAAGHELGWGFQLQSPLFVYSLALLLFIFALNLSGVFEFGTSLTRLGGAAEQHEGYQGTFFSGMLATLVATPCAAPILAGALGTALSLPPALSMLVFTFIALGLATPYLALSLFPSLVQKLPRPGPWMETFKQAMAFLLYGTVAYLIWVLLGQVSGDKSIYLLFGLVLSAVAAWVYGRFAGLAASTRSKWIARSLTLLLLIGSVDLGLSAMKPSTIDWEPWSQARVEELRNEGRTVYVDFTARWCVTCQANKKLVFSSDKVIQTFKQKNVAALKADWTNQDPTITRALAEFNRSAVPFNLIYQPGASEPTILPEILTPGIVLDALQTSE